jgi:hypothetical protein
MKKAKGEDTSKEKLLEVEDKARERKKETKHEC